MNNCTTPSHGSQATAAVAKAVATRQRILTAAVELATETRRINVTREQVASRADCSNGLVSHYFGDMQALQAAVMTEAVNQRLLPLIAAGLALGDAVALAAPAELRAAAVASLGGDITAA